MKMVAPLCISLASSAAAESISCDMAGVPVNFDIDLTQFAPPVDPGEPPRRRVTTVAIGEDEYEAEPMVMGDMRGFWTDGTEPPQIIMIIHPDGAATLTNAPEGAEVSGRCEVVK